MIIIMDKELKSWNLRRKSYWSYWNLKRGQIWAVMGESRNDWSCWNLRRLHWSVTWLENSLSKHWNKTGAILRTSRAAQVARLLFYVSTASLTDVRMWSGWSWWINCCIAWNVVKYSALEAIILSTNSSVYVIFPGHLRPQEKHDHYTVLNWLLTLNDTTIMYSLNESDKSVVMMFGEIKSMVLTEDDFIDL